ncbi:unnamed protein product, partial [Prorocentrum cordatum]
ILVWPWRRERGGGAMYTEVEECLGHDPPELLQVGEGMRRLDFLASDVLLRPEWVLIGAALVLQYHAMIFWKGCSLCGKYGGRSGSTWLRTVGRQLMILQFYFCRSPWVALPRENPVRWSMGVVICDVYFMEWCAHALRWLQGGASSFWQEMDYNKVARQKVIRSAYMDFSQSLADISLLVFCQVFSASTTSSAARATPIRCLLTPASRRAAAAAPARRRSMQGPGPAPPLKGGRGGLPEGLKQWRSVLLPALGGAAKDRDPPGRGKSSITTGSTAVASMTTQFVMEGLERPAPQEPTAPRAERAARSPGIWAWVDSGPDLALDDGKTVEVLLGGFSPVVPALGLGLQQALSHCDTGGCSAPRGAPLWLPHVCPRCLPLLLRGGADPGRVLSLHLGDGGRGRLPPPPLPALPSLQELQIVGIAALASPLALAALDGAALRRLALAQLEAEARWPQRWCPGACGKPAAVPAEAPRGSGFGFEGREARSAEGRFTQLRAPEAREAPPPAPLRRGRRGAATMGSACERAGVEGAPAGPAAEAPAQRAERLRQQHQELKDRYRTLERDVHARVEQNRELKQDTEDIQSSKLRAAEERARAAEEARRGAEEAAAQREEQLELLRSELAELQEEVGPAEALAGRLAELQHEREEAARAQAEQEAGRVRAEQRMLAEEHAELGRALEERRARLGQAEEIVERLRQSKGQTLDRLSAGRSSPGSQQWGLDCSVLSEAPSALSLEIAELRAENAALKVRRLDMEELAEQMVVRAEQAAQKFETAGRALSGGTSLAGSLRVVDAEPLDCGARPAAPAALDAEAAWAQGAEAAAAAAAARAGLWPSALHAPARESAPDGRLVATAAETAPAPAPLRRLVATPPATEARAAAGVRPVTIATLPAAPPSRGGALPAAAASPEQRPRSPWAAGVGVPQGPGGAAAASTSAAWPAAAAAAAALSPRPALAAAAAPCGAGPSAPVPVAAAARRGLSPGARRPAAGAAADGREPQAAAAQPRLWGLAAARQQAAAAGLAAPQPLQRPAAAAAAAAPTQRERQLRGGAPPLRLAPASPARRPPPGKALRQGGAGGAGGELEALVLQARVSYNAGISACEKGEQWHRALALLSEMREAKLELDVISYNAGISACEKGEQWQRALALLSEMREAKLEPNVISYNAGISACKKGEQWQRALALLSEMRETKLEPNVISYNAGISACEKGEQWQRALALLSEMREAKLKGEQWQRALALLSEMREAKLELDVISYSAGISACEKGEQWQRAWRC